MISGILTLIFLLGFLGIAAWAWSARTQPRFDAAAQLPLRDEAAAPTRPLDTALRAYSGRTERSERAEGCCGQCGGMERPR